MGYIKRWNIDTMRSQVFDMMHTATDPRQDGFTTWPIKQELYQLKWAVEDALERCSTYSTEKEWVDEQLLKRDQEKMWNILKTK
jgi:hypothetical protein